MAANHLEIYTIDVPGAGTAVRVKNTTRKVLKIWAKGAEGNVGANVYIGDSSVSATASGWSIPNIVDAKPLHLKLAEAPPTQDWFYVDVDTSGDDVEVFFLLA